MNGQFYTAPDVQNAEHLVTKQERGTDHYFDAVLPQDRIRRPSSNRLGQRAPLPRCGDPTGETCSERHTDALANFLLNAARTSCDEFVRTPVEQEHRDRVRIEYVPYTLQQLAEQLIDTPCCQLAVGQGPKVRKTLAGLNVR